MNGAPYGSAIALSGTISADVAHSCCGTVAAFHTGIKNGAGAAGDGLALVSSTGCVVQFLSYEGSLTGTSGPAVGLNAQDIGVQELGAQAEGLSLQLRGGGSAYSDFAWVSPEAASAGSLNAGQTFMSARPTFSTSCSVSSAVLHATYRTTTTHSQQTMSCSRSVLLTADVPDQATTLVNTYWIVLERLTSLRGLQLPCCSYAQLPCGDAKGEGEAKVSLCEHGLKPHNEQVRVHDDCLAGRFRQGPFQTGAAWFNSADDAVKRLMQLRSSLVAQVPL